MSPENPNTHRQIEESGIPPALRPKLLQPTARVHLFWALVEDALRNEVNHSSAVAKRWSRNLQWIGRGVQPLAHVFSRVATDHKLIHVTELEESTKFAAKQIKIASKSIVNTRNLISSRFYIALGALRRARLALVVLLRRIGVASEVDLFLSNWTASDLSEIEQSHTLLQESLDSFLAVLSGEDTREQCLNSRQLFLALYWATTFDDHKARIYYQPIVKGHQMLVDRMPPCVPRECVRQRLELLLQISPHEFSATALRIAHSRIIAQSCSVPTRITEVAN